MNPLLLFQQAKEKLKTVAGTFADLRAQDKKCREEARKSPVSEYWQNEFNRKTNKVEKRGWISDDTYAKIFLESDKSRASLEAISKIEEKIDSLKLRISEKNWRSWNLNADYQQIKTEISSYRLELPPIEGNPQWFGCGLLLLPHWSYPQ